ncbi:MAG: bifunctional aspartate kinase/diaminopimelate decarboxylase [Legionellales bacterium]|nr:bifunctional aspartate kinase/diaminopimelate decarboxylase [Legionellales bacterium]
MQSITTQQQPWVVVKFGGKSVAERSCWETIATIVQRHQQQGLRPLIVCSAISQMTNTLEQLLKAAIIDAHEPVLAEIRARHAQLAADLEVPFDLLHNDMQTLERISAGIALIGEVTPRLSAKILAFGEQMLTRLGAAFLFQQGLDAAWYDSRELLISQDTLHAQEHTAYLSAHCDYEQDINLQQKLANEPHQVLITQGFVAANTKGETVLLGRGGSDTSAAYLAAKLGAARCEIWTDVPGIYTANPHQVPEAQVLKYLDYDEAREIAAMGGKVLHPRCLHPVKYHRIPMYVACTFSPETQGSLITSNSVSNDRQIKAILTRYDLTLMSIEALEMWQQAGFLTDVFHCFKRQGISIDLISTSEFNITVSIDLKAQAHDSKVLDAVLAELNVFCKATVISPCASISLVGHNIRAIFHKLGNAFTVFEEQQIHLISQAANDLNLTFVVNEDQVERLVTKLHSLLFSELYTPKQETDYQQAWWYHKREQLLALSQTQSIPAYIYDRETLAKSITQLQSLAAIDRLFYAVKANNYHEILRQFYHAGIGFECVSLTEVEYILSLFNEINPTRIMFTPNFAPRSEYEAAMKLGINITIDNLHPLMHWPELFSEREIFVRIDPGQGHGHHKHVCTAGDISKFGIPLAQLSQLVQIVQQEKIKVIGLHAHTGSGILTPQIWQQVAIFLAGLTSHFKDVRYLNLGGGLGVAERAGQKPLDMNVLNELLCGVKVTCPQLEFWLEPGRFFVAQAGVLLARVTQIKSKGNMTFIGIDTGMNSLIRPALYGSWHEVVNLTRLHEPRTITANIVGPICESGDTLAFSRLFPLTQEGDIILIANTGAYGHTMSSNYNMRIPAQEQCFE